jgi:hypothetical protein
MSIFHNISIILNNNSSLRYTATSPRGRRMEFVFRYVYVGESWRAYIVSSPGYGYWSADPHATHRYYDSSRNMHFVCWTHRLLKFADAVEVSQLWARETAKYIETGRGF